MPPTSLPATHRRRRLNPPSLRAAAVAVVFALFLSGPGQSFERTTDGLRINDALFWDIMSAFSEPDGYFHSDNLVSNELAFQHVIPTLREERSGGAYVGVGPDQNFTYMIAVEPRIAFIVDVRRHNALLHLIYKAIVEMAPTRAAFLSRLFSRPVPAGLERDAPPSRLVAAFVREAPDRARHERDVRDVLKRLTRTHRFPLSSEDQVAIRQVYGSFFESGPEISYTVRGMEAFDAFPSYADLIQTTDDSGENHSYLASERHYERLRKLQQQNLVVPIVGDFAGSRALRSVARFLEERDLPVAAFYTSNVEFYLFRNGRWQDFAENLARFPVNGRSVVIRTSFHGDLTYSAGAPYPNSRTLMEPIPDLVRAFQESLIRSYEDVLERSR